MESNRNYVIAYHKGFRVDHYGNVISFTGKKRTLDINKNGYYRFTIRHKDKLLSVTVHQLQAYTKYGKKYLAEGIQARHFNGNPLDNSWDNIKIGTPSQNMMDKPKNIRVRSATIASNAANPRTKDERVRIHKMLQAGIPYSKISQICGVNKSTLSYMKNQSLEYSQ